jgi:hypothetical protein
VAALTPSQPACLALWLHPEHATDDRRGALGVGAVRVHRLDTANRYVRVDVRGCGDERLILAVVDHELELQGGRSTGTWRPP